MAAENALAVEYNGVEIRCSHLISWDRFPVNQGPDVLYTTHRIHMVGTLHEKFDWGNTGAEIKLDRQDVVNLLKRLQAPRKKLSIKLAESDKPWIETTLDQNQGPQVVGHRLSNLIGIKQVSLEVIIEFTTHEGEPSASSTPRILLSNRWEMIEDIDRFFRKRIMVRGRAIFRRDNLNLIGFEPDQFRKWCLWPLQKGYKRVSKRSGVGPTGVELFYETIDEQTYVDVLAKDIADMKVIHNYRHFKVSPELVDKALLTNAIKTANSALGRVGDAFNANKGGPVGALAGMANDAIQGGLQNLEIGYSMLPRHVGHIVVWVKGTPHALMTNLARAANRIATFRLQQLPLSCPTVDSQIQADFTEREVTIIGTHEAAPLQGNLNIVGGFSGQAAVNIDGLFFKSELGVPGVVTSFNHNVPFDAPQNGRGDGQTLLTVAKALITDTQTPPSGVQEAKRATVRPINSDPTLGGK